MSDREIGKGNGMRNWIRKLREEVCMSMVFEFAKSVGVRLLSTKAGTG